MISPHPSPTVFFLLILFLPGIWILAHRASREVVPELAVPYAVPGVFLCLWLALVHWIGMVSQSFYVGLAFGTLPAGLLGYYVQWSRPISLWGSVASKRTVHPRTAIALAVCCLLYLPAIFAYDFHDKLDFISGHFSISEQILNDIYPPRDLYDPSRVLGYHFGGNTLFASVSAIFRLSMDISIDLVSILMWAYYLWLGSFLAIQLFRAPMESQWIAVLICAFAGGFPWILATGFDPVRMMTSLYSFPVPLGTEWHNTPVLWVHMPFPSWFLSHPWTVGLPIFNLCLLFYVSKKPLNPVFRQGLLCLGLNVLFFTSLPTALALTAAMVTCLGVEGFRRYPKAKNDLALVGILLANALFCLGVSSMLASVLKSGGGASSFDWASYGIAGGLWNSFLWNLTAFGALIPMGYLAFRKLSEGRWVFLLLVMGGVLLPNVVRYRFTFDMWKFTLIATVGLTLISAGYCAKQLSGRLKSAFVALAVLVSLQGSFFLISFSLFPVPYKPSVRTQYAAMGLTPDHWSVIHALKSRIGPGELVCTRTQLAMAYATLGGFPECVLDANVQVLGNPIETVRRRTALLQNTKPSIEQFREEGVGWIVLDERSPRAFLQLIADWESRGQVANELRVGEVSLIRVLPQNVSTGA